ncbi:MAG: hydrogenase expression/formation protein HypE [Gammaproteobacteria bacterium]
MSAAAKDVEQKSDIRRRSGKVRGDSVTLAHGSGGKAMRDLIDDIFVSTFDNDQLSNLEDQARLQLENFDANGDRIAMTTDSYVVDPLFFPGGNIGSLAVNGTVNDLAVGGAKPLALTCSMIIEEGLPIETLRKVVTEMKQAADNAGVNIVTGDTKVVHRGAADKLFINTAGVGVIPKAFDLTASNIQEGDVIITNGFLGDHGAAIVDARGELAIENTINSDCQALNHLIEKMLDTCPDIRCIRDATRGGIATVLNEFAQQANLCMRLNEDNLPVREEVKGMCEILGLDPLYLANEGKLVACVPKDQANALIKVMREDSAGKDAVIVGDVSASPEGVVVLSTVFGGDRIVDMLVGEQLPRIC